MKKNYVSPSAEVVEVKIEKGFATSGAAANDYAAEGAAGGLQQGQSYNF